MTRYMACAGRLGTRSQSDVSARGGGAQLELREVLRFLTSSRFQSLLEKPGSKVAIQKVRRQDRTTLACFKQMRTGRFEPCRQGGIVATYEIIVTDVTCYGSLYCVAGWDRLTGQMIRPEPPGAKASNEPSRFWNSGYAGPGKTFAVGNVVRVGATGALPDFLFPHATEDRMVDMNTPMNVLQTLDSQGVVAAVAAGVSNSLTRHSMERLFERHREKRMSRRGTADPP